jgi:hypothetical protein
VKRTAPTPTAASREGEGAGSQARAERVDRPNSSWNREPGDDSDDQGKGSDHDDRAGSQAGRSEQPSRLRRTWRWLRSTG